MKTEIYAKLPPALVAQARRYVDQGWAGDFNELLTEALRRYLDSHSLQLAEEFVRQDVAWGLSGSCGRSERRERRDQWEISIDWRSGSK